MRWGGNNNDGTDHTSCHLLDLWPISSAILMTQKQLVVDVEVVVTYKIRPDPDFPDTHAYDIPPSLQSWFELAPVLMRLLYVKKAKDRRPRGDLRIMRAMEKVTFEDPRRLELLRIMDILKDLGPTIIGPKDGILSKLYIQAT